MIIFSYDEFFFSYECWGRTRTGGDFWRCRERGRGTIFEDAWARDGVNIENAGSGSFSKNEQGPGRSLVPQTPENMLPNALSNPIALLLGTSGCTHLAHCTDSRTASLYLILAQVSAVPSTLYLPKPKKNWIRRKLPTSGIEDFFGGHYVTAHYDLKSPKCGQIQ